MKVFKGRTGMKTVKTNSKTEWTGKKASSLYKAGNDGNTHGTRLPEHGCPRGAKKRGKRRKGY
jgi:hypothetical protein